MIDIALIFLHLVAVTAFVPASDGGYTEWDIVISEDHTQFRATDDHRVFIVVGYSLDRFTDSMLKLWNFELYGTK